MHTFTHVTINWWRMGPVTTSRGSQEQGLTTTMKTREQTVCNSSCVSMRASQCVHAVRSMVTYVCDHARTTSSALDISNIACCCYSSVVAHPAEFVEENSDINNAHHPSNVLQLAPKSWLYGGPCLSHSMISAIQGVDQY